MAMAVFLSGLLLLNPACGSVDVAEESVPGPVAAGSPSIIDLVKRDIKKGDEVRVTEKNGTVHSLKVSKIDDEGIHGRDLGKKRVTIPFDDFRSLAVKRGVIGGVEDDQQGSGDSDWVVTAGKVVVVGGLGYFMLREAAQGLTEDVMRSLVSGR